MIRRPAVALLFVAAVALLAGCAGHRPSTSTGDGIGLYKVGQPYQIDGSWYYPAEDFAYDETGTASWYGADFHGKNTANGEVFNLNELTAAHRTLPLPSIVQVTNLENGRAVNLRVNDRGPYARGRIIDVSRRGAQLLGFEGSGTAKVRVKILVPESIQVASLARRNGGDDKPESLQALPVAAVAAQPLPPPPPTPRLAANAVAAVPPPPPPAAEPVTLAPVTSSQIFIQAGAFTVADNALKVKSRLDRLGAVKVQGVKVRGVDVYRVRLGPIASVDEADRLLDRVVASGLAEARIVVE
jgi:rare lipoprotein A